MFFISTLTGHCTAGPTDPMVSCPAMMHLATTQPLTPRPTSTGLGTHPKISFGMLLRLIAAFGEFSARSQASALFPRGQLHTSSNYGSPRSINCAVGQPKQENIVCRRPGHAGCYGFARALANPRARFTFRRGDSDFSYGVSMIIGASASGKCVMYLFSLVPSRLPL